MEAFGVIVKRLINWQHFSSLPTNSMKATLIVNSCFCSKFCLDLLFSIIINLKCLTDVINFMLSVMKDNLEQKFDGRRSSCSVEIQTLDLPTHASALLIDRSGFLKEGWTLTPFAVNKNIYYLANLGTTNCE